MDASIKLLQVVRLAMLVSVVVYVLTMRLLPSGTPAQPPIFYVMALLAIMCVAALLTLRRIFVQRAETRLATQPEDRRALAQWRTGYLVTYCLSEAIALYGLVLHSLGFAFSQVVPFCLAGFVLILFYRPRRPSSALG
jgi:hypothetical protein